MQINALGVTLENGCRVTHGVAANVKKPFEEVSLIMHELSQAADGHDQKAYVGQLGFIPFTSEYRLPRHVHMSVDDKGEQRFLAERILVLHGVALTELGGEIYLVAPGTLVDIIPGIPHTWTACPAGVTLPDGTVSDGTFTMVYNYEDTTGFSPTRSTQHMNEVSEYERYEGDLADIMFPKLSPVDVVEKARLVWGNDKQAPISLA